MRVLVASGIFPPDIGGPATHSADLAAELRARGHTVTVLTLTDGRRVSSRELVRFPRSWPWPVRSLAVLAWVALRGRRYDAVYATGLGPEAVAGARLARRPVVLKTVGDPAWERSRRRALTDSDFDSFQDDAGGTLGVRLMRFLRNWAVRHATALVTPSDYLARVVERWSGRTGEVVVIPNGVRVDEPATEEVAAGDAQGELRAVYVGRLVGHKRVEVLIEATALVPDVWLTIVGEGPERATLEALVEKLDVGDRTTFRGSLPHDDVLGALRDAQVMVSASSYEGLPHTFIEALVCGTPIVTSDAGGSTEVVEHGLNGCVVDPPDAAGFALALRILRESPPELERLAAGATASGTEHRFERCADRIETLLGGLLDRGR